MLSIKNNGLTGVRERPQKTRAAILRAAVREFALEGVAGARTDAIARGARVNKALLYYYFEDKEALYGAVLDQVFGGLTHTVLASLSQDLPVRQKILAYAGAHFDYIAGNPLYPRIVQAEMMRAGRNPSPHFEHIVNRYFHPLFVKISEVLRAGVASGDFRPVNPLHFMPSMVAVIVFYFTSAPVMRMMTGEDPMSPSLVAERRAAVLDFIAAALFHPNAPPRGRRP
jgi:TetR/AcrR family transcriptional regulator